MPMVPVFPAPVSTKGLDATWSYDAEQQVVFSQRSRSGGKKYEFDFVHMEYSPEALRTAKPLSQNNANQKNFTSVPENATVRALVDQLTQGKNTVYDEVRALYDYFSSKNDFKYDLTVQTGTTGQQITDFLTTKRGFCRQYAAALAWMVRQAGIPARVAFGFTKGSNYNSTNKYVLTNHNLHAWTEVYFDGFGWVPFDATPTSSVTGAVNPAWAPDPDVLPDSNPTAVPTGDPNAEPLPGQTSKPGDNTDGIDGQNGQSTVAQTPAWLWWSIGGGIAIVALLFVPALRRKALRRRRGRWATAPAGDIAVATNIAVVGGPDADGARRRAHAAWDELLDTMTDYRVLIDPAETPRSTAERLILAEQLPTEAAEQIRRLSLAEERARYAPHPVSGDGLMTAVQAVRKVLASNATRWVRLVAVLLPPSVTQRWSTLFSTTTARISARFADVGYAMRRLLRPLRLRRAMR
jgi:hypothetical protein